MGRDAGRSRQHDSRAVCVAQPGQSQSALARQIGVRPCAVGRCGACCGQPSRQLGQSGFQGCAAQGREDAASEFSRGAAPQVLSQTRIAPRGGKQVQAGQGRSLDRRFGRLAHRRRRIAGRGRFAGWRRRSRLTRGRRERRRGFRRMGGLHHGLGVSRAHQRQRRQQSENRGSSGHGLNAFAAQSDRISLGNGRRIPPV